MAENFIRSISDRRGVKMLSLFYLTDDGNFDNDVPLRDIAEKYSFHPSSISYALDPLLEDSDFSGCLEKKKIRNFSTYRIQDTKYGRFLKRLFDVIRIHFYEA